MIINKMTQSQPVQPTQAPQVALIPLVPPAYAIDTPEYLKFWSTDVFTLLKGAQAPYLVPVSATLAARWLGRNKNNRNVQPGRVKLMTADIHEGRWRAHGQGVTFNRKGFFIDGQHRLTAIVASGQTAYITVFFNAEDDAVDFIDAGQERSHGQRMQMAFPNMHAAPVAATIARAILVALSPGGHVGKVSFEQVLSTYERYNLGIDFAKEHMYGKRDFKKSAVMAGIALSHSMNPVAIEDLAKRAMNPENHKAGDPALALRNYVTDALRNSSKRETEIRPVTMRVLRAAKAAVRKERIAVLREDSTIFSFFGLM